MPVTQRRPDRVAHLIQQILGELLLHEIRDLRLSRVVITGSKVTPDLRLAHVYYTVMGEEDPSPARQETERALLSATPFFRREIGRAIRLRYTPELSFHFDETLQVARRMESLLATIQPPPSDPDREPEGGDP
ncbi:MAG: 30S ribosome-binding factor RbfA [Bradymonadales bacterium]|nr:30S ribosome-binding factor RbfA [Bradymonadales bacterium]